MTQLTYIYCIEIQVGGCDSVPIIKLNRLVYVSNAEINNYMYVLSTEIYKNK